MYRYLAVLCVNEECAQRHCNRLANNDHPLVLLDARVPVSHCSTSDATGASPEPGTGLSSDSGSSQEPVLVFGQPPIEKIAAYTSSHGLKKARAAARSHCRGASATKTERAEDQPEAL